MADDIQPDDFELDVSKSNIDVMANATIHKLMADIVDLRSRGQSQETIRESITADIGNGRLGVGQLRAQINDETEKLQQRWLGQGTAEKLNAREEQLFMWYSIGRNTCRSCIARHGIVQTLSEWRRDGLPSMGQTICRTKCQCKVLPMEIAATKIYGLPADTTPKQLTARAKTDVVKRAKEIERISKAREKAMKNDFAQSTKLQMLGNFGESFSRVPPNQLTKKLRLTPSARKNLKPLFEGGSGTTVFEDVQVAIKTLQLSPILKKHLGNIDELRATGIVQEYEALDPTRKKAAYAGIFTVDLQLLKKPKDPSI